MKIYGQRSDGSLLISLGGGVGVVMRGTHASKAFDLGVLQKQLGPWSTPSAEHSDVRKVAKQLDRCQTLALSQFSLGAVAGMSFDEKRVRVEQALCSRLGIPTNGMGYGPMSLYVPMNGMGEDWVVYVMNGKHYGLGYAIDEASGGVSFDGTAQEVEPSLETLADRDEVDLSVDLKNSTFFKNYAKAKKDKKLTSMPGSLPNVGGGSMPSTVSAPLKSNY